MLEWSWRVETGSTIAFGSSSDDANWEKALAELHGSTVADVALFGVIPELAITLSNGRRIASFMTADGDPSWTIFDRRTSPERWLHVRDCHVVEEAA